MWGMVARPLSQNVRGNRFPKGIRWRVVLSRSLRGKEAGKGNKFIFPFLVFLSLVRIPFPGIALLCFALLFCFALVCFALHKFRLTLLELEVRHRLNPHIHI